MNEAVMISRRLSSASQEDDDENLLNMQEFVYSVPLGGRGGGTWLPGCTHLINPSKWILSFKIVDR